MTFLHHQESKLYWGQGNLAASATKWGRKQAESQREKQAIPLSTATIYSAKRLFSGQVSIATAHSALVATSFNLSLLSPSFTSRNVFKGSLHLLILCRWGHWNPTWIQMKAAA